MSAIDLIVLGMLKRKPLSAYDLQKLVEYRNISKWVKISTPSIYKKVLQLESKGLIIGTTAKEGKMPEKQIYELTEEGSREFLRLMGEISDKPVNFFLDLNAVVVNLEYLSEAERAVCVSNMERRVKELERTLEESIAIKEHAENIPETGMAVLRQQYVLAQTIEKWLAEVK